MDGRIIGIIAGIVLGAVLALLLRKLFGTRDDRGQGYRREDSDRAAYGRSSGKSFAGPDPGLRPSNFKKPAFKRIINTGFYPGYLPPRYDEVAIVRCAELVGAEAKVIRAILKKTHRYYSQFCIRKRSGGVRKISAPDEKLMRIQKGIYHRILLPAPVHPAATGFRKKVAITDNARRHLGNTEVFKTDIRNFFTSIRYSQVVRAFVTAGCPKEEAKVFAGLCCKGKRLPQGAPTSPAVSNIVAYAMDEKLSDVASRHGLVYTRYADDLTFSGEAIDYEILQKQVQDILYKEGFFLQQTKTRWMGPHKRKIITGISVSTGDRLTIPKATKRELRKNVYFILTRGVKAHKKAIGSRNPAYLKKIIGQMYFWLMVEPDNEFVSRSIKALKKLER